MTQPIDPMVIGMISGAAIIGAIFAVTFVLKIIKPRGQDLTVTHQVKGVEAKDAKEAMKKAYDTLSDTQKDQVTKVYLTRDDSE